MEQAPTNKDIQTTFVESLYSSLRKTTARALEDHKKFLTLASTYLADGLDDGECSELLMIDGLSREAAENYTNMARADSDPLEDSDQEYAFRFEDIHGNVWSSYDVGKVVTASSEKEAWQKAEELLYADSSFFEADRVTAVQRID